MLFRSYIDAKRNIVLYQPFYGRLVLNAGNYETKSFNSDARGEVVWFSQNDPEIRTGFLNVDGQLVWRNQDVEVPIVSSLEIIIPGRHNVDNYLAAAAAVWPFVKPEDIAEVARTFGGVEHRLELVRELGGVRYYNSSIDTSPTRTKAALRALAERNERVVLIAGGQDKKCDYTGLGEAIVAVSKKIILCGDNSDQIEKVLRRESAFKGIRFEDLIIHRCANYDDAVNKAHSLAEPGELVILSPAGTSYDQFRHFEERGNLFKELVNKLRVKS